MSKLKRGRLSKVEEIYIHTQMKTDTVEDIAAELGRSVSAVKKYIEGKRVEPKSKVEEHDDAIDLPKPGDDAREAIIEVYKGVNMKNARERARIIDKRTGKKTGIVSTEEMSGKSDSVRGNNLKSGSRLTEGAIFKPLKED